MAQTKRERGRGLPAQHVPGLCRIRIIARHIARPRLGADQLGAGDIGGFQNRQKLCRDIIDRGLGIGGDLKDLAANARDDPIRADVFFAICSLNLSSSQFPVSWLTQVSHLSFLG